jgi:hypothetical protein
MLLLVVCLVGVLALINNNNHHHDYHNNYLHDMIQQFALTIIALLFLSPMAAMGATHQHTPKHTTTTPSIISEPTNTKPYTGPSSNTPSSSKHSSSSPTLSCRDARYNGTCASQTSSSLQTPTQQPTTLAPGIPVTSTTCPKGFTLQSDGSCLNTDPSIGGPPSNVSTCPSGKPAPEDGVCSISADGTTHAFEDILVNIHYDPQFNVTS